MSSKIDPDKIFSNKLSQLNTCHKVIFKFQDLLTDIELEKYYSYFEVLILKYQMKSISLMNLLKGSKYEQMDFIDIPSLFILLRGLIENYLMFNYLYIEPSSKDETYFRTLIYQRSGLLNRQQYSAIPKDHPILIKEAVEIEELTTLIEKNPLYQNLDKKKRTRIKAKATSSNYIEIMNSSKLKNTDFITFWKLCSNFAHSEYISGMQIRTIYIDKTNPNDLFLYKHNILLHSLYLIVLIIEDFRSMFPQLNDYYDKDPNNIKSIANEFNILDYNTRIKSF